ncbi:response regulator [Wukongibacter baidiensis]|uniref:response regulator n=1 Tax=Wukongibacter baidiensis TaxID=1723361 RepID=UPI003D7F3E7D
MLKDKKLLIVEDSSSFRLLIKAMLKDTGATVFEAGSQFGMYQAIDQYGEVVDLIIMDLTLKFENGLDLIKNLKSQHRYRDIPVIIVTQDISKANIIEAKKLGVKHYIKKPFNKSILLDRIKDIFS